MNLRQRWSSATAAVCLGALVASAAIHEGIHRTDLDLNDGGIWITNESQHLVGRLNFPSKEIDAVLRTPSSSFDVTQNAQDVLVPDADSSSIAAIDTIAVQFTGKTPIESGATVLQGADRVVVVNRAQGTVRATTVASMSAVATTEPLITDSVGLVATVGVDGSIHAVNAADASVTTWTANTSGAWSAPVKTKLDVDSSADLAITAVGKHPVILDRGSGTVYLPDDRTVALGEPGLALQQPGPDADSVLLASRTGLVSVPLDGSAPTTTPAAEETAKNGVPAQPVHLGECDYAAWAGSGSFLRQCGSEPERIHDDALASSSKPVFRTNRDVVVLNDVKSGSVWTLEDELTLVDDWTTSTAQTTDDSDTRDNSAETSDSTALPERTEENHAPVANDDILGARPGRSTTLPVLQNDSDQDGDVLTATVGDYGSKGTVTAVRSGRALQLDLPEEASGSLTIPYSVDDGRGLSDSAVATVSVHPWTENGTPEQVTVPSLELVEHASGAIDVLPHWKDPDGDALALVSAVGDGFDLRWTAEGHVSILEASGTIGPRNITLTVSDGIETTTGRLNINVIAESDAQPIANADHVRVVAGSPITVSPLDNDASPRGGDLKLSQVQEAPAGTRLDVDQGAGTFTFSSDTPQTYYISYGITDGPSVANGFVRIDVTAKTESTVPPVVENDTAMLRSGGSTTIAPLANDFDPLGGVLVLQSVSVPDDSHVTATIVDHSFLQLSTADSVERSTSITYTVTNGTTSATGTIALVPMSESELQAPIAEADRAVVRVDDIVSIPVLDNDSSPSGLSLNLGPEITNSDPDVGLAWASGDLVRFKASGTPGRTVVSYTAVDEHGQQTRSTVSIEVTARDDNANSAPHPVNLEARALVGTTTPIKIPLNGMDRDGDSVTLLGVDQPPSLGTVGVEATWLTYTPSPGAVGTDSFTYRVEDRFGAQATGTIRVGIAAPLAENHAPQAVDDIVTIRPGRIIAVDAVSNDIDPDGDALTLGDVPTTSDDALGATTRSGRVLLTAPLTEGVYAVRYTVTDSHGGSDIGTITVQVSNEAPTQSPIAADDVVPLDSIDAEGNVRVDVLANDIDPDGSQWSLTVATDDPSAQVDGDAIRVTVGTEWHLVVYTITDPDGLVGRAVIVVPGRTGLRPHINAATVPVRVPANTSTRIALADHVITRAGTTPIITESSTIRTSAGSRASAALEGSDTLVFTPSKDFSGATSITFRAADGSGSDALSEILTLPVLVISDTNTAPTFTPTPIEVGIGETPVVVDLAQMAHDAENDPLRYSIGAIPEGFSVSLAGSRLTVSATDSAEVGALGSLSVTVDDSLTTPTTGSIPLKIIESSQPLMTTSPTTVSSNGEAVSIDVSTLVTNPFPGKQITIHGVPRIVSGSGSIATEGTVLTITPDPAFTGRILAEYRVLDATGNPARAVSGTVTVVVSAPPGAPIGVRATARGASAMEVSWTDGPDNGSPITGYTLTEVSSGATWQCTASPCRATGLALGGTYSFTVNAINRIGVSPASAPSAPQTLTVTPDTPSTPTLVGGAGTLTAQWRPPAPIEGVAFHYELELSNGARRTVHDLTASFNLAPGTYSLRIRTVVENGGASPWVSSAAASVYGPPSAPGTPRITTTEDSMTISWSDAQANGDPVSYDVWLNGASNTTVSTGALTTTTITALSPGDYTVYVTATNRGGSAASDKVPARITASPLAPSTPSFNATGYPGQITVASAAVPRAGSGWATSDLSIEYRVLRDGSAVTGWTSGPTFDGLIDGQPHVIEARAAGRGPDGTTMHSASVASAPVTPYGPPAPPTVSCTTKSSTTVTCSWKPGADGGLRPISYYGAYSSDGTGSVPISTGSLATLTSSEGQTLTWCVSAVNAANQSSGWVCDSATTSITTGKFTPNITAPESTCTQQDVDESRISPPSECRRIVLDVAGFAPNSTVSCEYQYTTYSTVDGKTVANDYWHRESFSVDDVGSARHVFPHRIRTSAVTNHNYQIPCDQE